MEGLVFLLCLCALSSISADPFEFKTTAWDNSVGSFPGAPPIKFTYQGKSLKISCETNDSDAMVKLFVKKFTENGTSRYVPARKHFRMRIRVIGQTYRIDRLTAGDEGKYKCTAVKRGKRIELFKGDLVVRVPLVQIIPELTPSAPLLKIQRGRNVEVNCSCAEHPKTEKSYLTWYQSTDKGDVVVMPFNVKTSRVVTGDKLVDTATLSLEGFDVENIGHYVCKREAPDGYTTFSKVSLFLRDHCYMNGELHPVGVKFISLSCTGQCECTDSNSVFCVSLCPPHGIRCPIGKMEVAIPENVSPSSNCTCNQKKCVSVADHCFNEGKLYKKGERFVTESCIPCKCHGFNSISCVSLCPPKKVKCGEGMSEHYELREAAPGCFCKDPVCLNATQVCKLKPETGSCYARFRRWHYDGVTKTCKRFTWGGCEGNPNRFVKKSNCENLCKVEEDKSTLSRGDCKFEDKWYKVGETYVSSSCATKCTCIDKKNNKMKCNSLCSLPPVPSDCGPGTMLVLEPKKASESPECYCDEGKCVKTADVCKMRPEPGSCFAAFRRWHYRPASKTCERFIYGGCEGNPNNFYTKEECMQTCGTNTVVQMPLAAPALKRVIISGKIQLSPGVGTLPNPSCASVKLIDETSNKVDKQVSSATFPISNIDISQGIDYQLASSHPDVSGSNKTYTLSAVVNVGWCKGEYSTHWIKASDYVTQKTYDVVINGREDEYAVDIDVSPIS